MTVAIARPIHPFPARMAADVAFAVLDTLPPHSVVLDPMAGSGTVLRAAAHRGLRAIGFDTDPLAVLMARVWTTPINADDLRQAARRSAVEARRLDAAAISLPWMDADDETQAFVAYWFATEQQRDLRRLASVLSSLEGSIADSLRVALSRIIVTKSGGASLSRDASHSRPHRVRDTNDYDVLEGFVHSANAVAARMMDQSVADVTVYQGDARLLPDLPSASVDAVITSPPYLNAIDYMRGHKLALVWLGYSIPALRNIRAENIGSERARQKSAATLDVHDIIENALGGEREPRLRRMIERYAYDLVAVLAQAGRALRPGSSATFVVGNSYVRGAFVHNDAIVIAAAERAGFTLRCKQERALPPNRRYLPPPTQTDSHFALRMRTESVLEFVRT